MRHFSGKPLRIGLVGLGKMGLLHASLLSVLPNVKLDVICDKSSLIRNICKRLFSRARIVDGVDKLTEENLDAIYITTPIPSHFSIVKALYSRGVTRNLFVEKTLASNYDQAKELCRLTEDSKAVNMVGYQKRFAVTFRKAKDFLDKNILGEIESFDAYAFSSDFSQMNSGLSTNTRGLISMNPIETAYKS